MESTPFELTPEQKGLLESLARETGISVASLIAKALERLREDIYPHHVNGETNSGDAHASAIPLQESRQPIWECFEDASRTIPDEELDRLPTDLAAQIDHYI
jgi:hypothetical protein